jgi:hypothetical protein
VGRHVHRRPARPPADRLQQRAQTESPEYIGRAIAALAGDPGIMRRTGHTLAVGNLAREYGLTDVGWRQPTAYPIVR